MISKKPSINTGASNQLRANPSMPATPAVNSDAEARIGNNTKGTGKRGVPTAIAESDKRKLFRPSQF